MNDLPKRLITAIILGIVVIGGIYFSAITFGIVLIIIGYFSALEYIELASNGAEISNPKTLTRVSAVGSIIPLLMYMILINVNFAQATPLAIILSLIFSSALFTYFLIKNEMGDWRMYQSYSLAIVYIGLPVLLFYWVCTLNGDYNWWKPMSLLILIWCNDIMAYFTGRFIGKRPLYKVISPKKTFEGFLGGLIFTVIGALALSLYILHLTPIQWVVYGFVVSILSTVGDLFESLIKRRYGVKDSGTSLPGHGGFLDRFDAFIFLLPVASLILYLFWAYS